MLKTDRCVSSRESIKRRPLSDSSRGTLMTHRSVCCYGDLLLTDFHINVYTRLICQCLYCACIYYMITSLEVQQSSQYTTVIVVVK